MHAVSKQNLKNNFKFSVSNIYPYNYNGVELSVNDLKGRGVVAICIGLCKM